jgi:hypothetical protein
MRAVKKQCNSFYYTSIRHLRMLSIGLALLCSHWIPSKCLKFAQQPYVASAWHLKQVSSQQIEIRPAQCNHLGLIESSHACLTGFNFFCRVANAHELDRGPQPVAIDMDDRTVIHE